jgi:tetratricopeptide (TPR) repeat protein
MEARRLIVQTYLRQGRIQAELSQWAGARRSAQAAQGVAEAMQSPELTGEASILLGRCLEAEGDTDEAIGTYEKAVEAIEWQRRQITEAPLAQSFFQENHYDDVYLRLARLLARGGEKERAQHYVEWAGTLRAERFWEEIAGYVEGQK